MAPDFIRLSACPPRRRLSAKANSLTPEGRTADGILLLDQLRKDEVARLYVGGLATDYCVRASVLDALSAGLTVTVLQDAIAGVDVRPEDSSQAIADMRKRGASFRQGGLLFD